LNSRDEHRMKAFIEAIHSHATATRPTGYAIVEYLDMTMRQFDKHFPSEKKDEPDIRGIRS
jgi:hypothetical protein